MSSPSGQPIITKGHDLILKPACKYLGLWYLLLFILLIFFLFHKTASSRSREWCSRSSEWCPSSSGWCLTLCLLQSTPPVPLKCYMSSCKFINTFLICSTMFLHLTRALGSEIIWVNSYNQDPEVSILFKCISHGFCACDMSYQDNEAFL